MDKKRRAVLVHELVAAIGVDMSHFCAVNVEGHLVLINSQSSRVHGLASAQDVSLGAGQVYELHNEQDKFKWMF